MDSLQRSVHSPFLEALADGRPCRQAHAEASRQAHPARGLPRSLGVGSMDSMMPRYSSARSESHGFLFIMTPLYHLRVFLMQPLNELADDPEPTARPVNAALEVGVDESQLKRALRSFNQTVQEIETRKANAARPNPSAAPSERTCEVCGLGWHCSRRQKFRNEPPARLPLIRPTTPPPRHADGRCWNTPHEKNRKMPNRGAGAPALDFLPSRANKGMFTENKPESQSTNPFSLDGRRLG